MLPQPKVPRKTVVAPVAPINLPTDDDILGTKKAPNGIAALPQPKVSRKTVLGPIVLPEGVDVLGTKKAPSGPFLPQPMVSPQKEKSVAPRKAVVAPILTEPVKPLVWDPDVLGSPTIRKPPVDILGSAPAPPETPSPKKVHVPQRVPAPIMIAPQKPVVVKPVDLDILGFAALAGGGKAKAAPPSKSLVKHVPKAAPPTPAGSHLSL